MCHNHSVSDEDREFMTKKVARLKKFYERIHEVSIILDAERHMNQAEILLWGPHLNLRVKGEAVDMRAAFEAAVDKAERSLTKTKEKMYDSRANRRRNVTIRRLRPDDVAGMPPAGAAAPTSQTQEEALPVERLEPQVLSVKDARALLERERDLVVFINADTQELNILRRNKADHVELIELSEVDVIAHGQHDSEAAAG
jgi:putative sigma-54 modulation protein